MVYCYTLLIPPNFANSIRPLWDRNHCMVHHRCYIDYLQTIEAQFQVLISLALSSKYPYKPHKLFQALTNIPHILPNIFHILPNLGSHKYFLYYSSWAHINTSHTITKIGLGPQNYTISIKAQTHLSCGQSPNTLTKPVATQHPKVHYYMAP